MTLCAECLGNIRSSSAQVNLPQDMCRCGVQPTGVYFHAGTNDSGYWLYAEVTTGGVLYPWVGKREAQRVARAGGLRAVFCEDEAKARLYLREVK